MNVIFLILCAFSSQEMVLASSDGSEPSLVPHIRRKRMEPAHLAEPGTSPSHELPPFLAYNLHELRMNDPTLVSTTKDGRTFGIGYAIHSFFILVDISYVRKDHSYGVSIPTRFGGNHVPQRIATEHKDPTKKYLLIELKDPIFLDNPQTNAFAIKKYPEYAIEWAKETAERRIAKLLLRLRPILEQKLQVAHFNAPTIVQVKTSEYLHPDTGYAVHPYIVITRRKDVGQNCHIVTFMRGSRQPQLHRIQFLHTSNDLNIEVIELLDPILLMVGEVHSLGTYGFSTAAINWAHSKVQEWKRTRLNQQNHYVENSLFPVTEKSG